MFNKHSFLLLVIISFAFFSGDLQSKDIHVLDGLSQFELNNSFHASYVGEDSGVSVIDFTGDFDKYISGQLNFDARQVVTTELYHHIEPDHQFL